MDYKYGTQEQKSTLNAINLMGWSGSGAAEVISKDIWDGKINVKYEKLAYDENNKVYGYHDAKEGKTITLNSSLLGGGTEESAKLGAVMTHEGVHAKGDRIEAHAHLAALEMYSGVTEKFGLEGDGAFSREMLVGINNPANWNPNEGDRDYYKVSYGYDKNGNVKIKKEYDGRDDYYIDTKDGEFKIWETEGMSYDDMKNDVVNLFERINLDKGMDDPTFDKKVKETVDAHIDEMLLKNLGLYEIVGPNGLFSADRLNEDDFYMLANSMPYYDGMGYYVDLESLGKKLVDIEKDKHFLSVSGNQYYSDPTEILNFNGSTFGNVVLAGFAQTVGYSISFDDDVSFGGTAMMDSVDRVEKMPGLKNDPEGNYIKSMNNKNYVQYSVENANNPIMERQKTGGYAADATISVFEFSLGALNAYKVNNYTVSTWQNQIVNNNNYFTIQCYVPVTGETKYSTFTTTYKYMYLSVNNPKYEEQIEKALNQYKKEKKNAF